MRESGVAAAIGDALNRQDILLGAIPASGSHEVPLVSVVMTTYQDDIDVLWRAIDSILTQTMRDLECVVVFEPVIPTPNSFPVAVSIRAFA